MSSFLRALHDNSLSILLGGLFLASWIGEALTGYTTTNEQLMAYGKAPESFGQWLSSGGFLNAMFVNWQAALLQLVTLVLAGAVLHQRGASHSRDPEKDEHEDDFEKRKERDEERRFTWIRRHSLSLALIGVFLLSFVAHVFVGTAAYNQQRALAGEAPLSVVAYVGSGQFWFENFQTWEAEFVVLLMFLVFTIYFREERSAESKPLTAGKTTTGETND